MNAVLSGSVDGGLGTDKIIGSGAADSFVVSSTNAGTVNGTSFTSVENLSGAGAGDTFTMNAGVSGTVDGGLGSDEIIGSGAADSFVVSSTNAGTVNGTSFTDVENLSGLAGDDTFAMNADVSGLVDGGDDDDEIIGAATANTFVVNSPDAGTVNGTSFNNVENLTGGANADDFTLSAALTGTAAGAGGDDTFNLDEGADAALIAGDAGSDEIVGAATANTFVVNAEDAGTANGIDFVSVENLTGGAGGDTFQIDAVLTGTASGDGDDDIFNLGTNGGAGSIDGGEDGTNGDEIAGAATPNTFVVNDPDAGSANGTAFTNVENLTGGAAGDTFQIDAVLTGTAAGEGEDDIFSLGTDGGAGSIDGGANGADGDEIVGAATANTFEVNAADAGTANGSSFAGVENLSGGAEADTFAFSAALTGTATGGGGDDTFTFEGGDVALAAGGDGNDTFVVDNGAFTGTAEGGSGDDLFDLNTNTGADYLGGADDDTFAIADGVVAAGTIDGGTGAADSLNLSEYSTSRSVSLLASDADGYDGTEASVSNGFSNINNVQASASGSSDALTGLDAAATWQVSGDTNNSYSSNGNTLGFENFEILNGGTAADTFQLGGGSQTGGLTIDGNAGADNAIVVDDLDVSADLLISNVESITSSGSGTLSATRLNIDGATDGIGDINEAVGIDVDFLSVTNAGDVYLVESNSLSIDGIDSTGNVSVESGANMLIALVSADNTVTLATLAGDIVNNNGTNTNIEANTVILTAPEGLVGTSASPITISVPRTTGESNITVTARGGQIINLLGAGVSTNVDDLDATAAGVSTAVGASVLSALEEIGFVDWAALDPDIELVDCLEPCIKLPADQLEEEGMAGLREPTQILVIRTLNGVKLVPVYVETIARRPQDMGEAGH
jgi:hypothetical protein